MCWVVHINIGIAEMQFQAGTEIRVLRTTVHFLYGIGLQRVNGAETDEAISVFCNLDTRPLIIFTDSFALVGDWWLVRIRKRVRRGEYNGARDVRFVHKGNKFVRGDAPPASNRDGASNGTVDVLMIIDDLR